MKNYRVLFLGMIAMSLTFSSCKKKKEPEPIQTEAQPLTTAESDDFFQKTASSLKTDITETSNSEVVTKLEAISFVSERTGTPSLQRVGADEYQGAFINLNSVSPALLLKKLLITRPVSSLNARAESHEMAFDFKANTGIYTWNNATESWDSAASTTKIEINFPSDTNKLDVNDGKLTILNYEETNIVDEDGTSQYMPTSMIAEFLIGTTKYASINYSGVFSSNRIPKIINLKAYLKPWNFETNGEDKGNSAHTTYRLFKDGEESNPVSSTSLNVTFENGDKEKPVLGTGFVTYRNMKIDATVKVKEMMDADTSNQDPTDAEINDWINVAVKRNDNGAKAAQMVFKTEDSTNDHPVLMQLNDGTLKTPEVYFQPVIDEINALSNN